jgi:predicted cupin superfamily sugar epimerase
MEYNKEKLIKKLNLKAHPEGGYYAEIYRDKKEYTFENGKKSISSAIYYLLVGGNFSAFHRIKSDEC